MNVFYYISYALWYLLSLLPLCFLYLISDVLFFLLFRVIKYRRTIVHENLKNSFPEKKKEERLQIEKEFYTFLCDYFVESIKLLSIHPNHLRKRMVFTGVETIYSHLDEHPLAFVYLGHYGNWEWITSLGLWTPNDVTCAQIYHPLHNTTINRLFLTLRNRFGAHSIAMKDTLREILGYRNRKEKLVIGFIADQTPTRNSIHHWVDFLHQDTPVFTGAERIAKKVNACTFYAQVRRIKRGYYQCDFKPMVIETKGKPDFEITDLYMNLLEEMIQKQPAIWLWSHRRWKRKRQKTQANP